MQYFPSEFGPPPNPSLVHPFIQSQVGEDDDESSRNEAASLGKVLPRLTPAKEAPLTPVDPPLTPVDPPLPAALPETQFPWPLQVLVLQESV